MSKKVRLTLTILSGILLLLVLVNIFMVVGNQSIQSDVGERQQVLAQSMQVENLHRQLVGVLANLALKNNDEQLKALLATVGINLPSGPEAKSAAK